MDSKGDIEVVTAVEVFSVYLGQVMDSGRVQGSSKGNLDGEGSL